MIKNTNVKIMHRLTSEDDRKILGSTMVVNAEQFVRAVTLNPGESFLFQEGWERPYHVQEHDIKGRLREQEKIDMEEPIPDHEVAAWMRRHWDASKLRIQCDRLFETISDSHARTLYVKARDAANTPEVRSRARTYCAEWNQQNLDLIPPRGDPAALRTWVKARAELPLFRNILLHKCAGAGVLYAVAEKIRPSGELTEEELIGVLAVWLYLTATEMVLFYRRKTQKLGASINVVLECQCDIRCHLNYAHG